MHCDPWSFKKGDSYTIVALNGPAPMDGPSPSSNLQHVDFKLHYITEQKLNVEVYGSPFDNRSLPPEYVCVGNDQCTDSVHYNK